MRDRIYVNLRDSPHEDKVKGREYLELLWQEASPYVDSDARKKATSDLAAVFWELYLTYALKSAGKDLVPRNDLGYTNNKGPDLFAKNPDVWLEAVAVRCGEGQDAIQPPIMKEISPGVKMSEVSNYNPDSVVLRLRSVIQDKSKIIQGYIANGIIQPGQATVIAVSGVALPWSHKNKGNPIPEIVRAVYPANDPGLLINRKTKAVNGTYVEHRDSIKKISGAEVATDIFLGSEFKHISAVLYGEADWVSHPASPGAEFKTVHNLMADTPLPDGWFPGGDEWWGDLSLRCVKHE